MDIDLTTQPARNEDVDDDKGEERPDRSIDLGEQAKLAVESNERIREYLIDRAASRDVVATTRTPRGQVLDWVPRESLAPDGKVADPPDEDGLDLAYVNEPADGKERRPFELVRFELESKGVELGPDGTVPVARRDVEAILSTKRLEDFLSKHGRAALLRPDGLGEEVALPEDGTVHKYAYSAQWVTAYGCEGNINAWDPYLEWSNEFSLGQCAVARGSGSSKQTIESGHQEYRDLYGDWVPHLFVFYTTNGYTQQGDNKGGYNQDVDGWVQYSSTVYPEALSSPVSTFGGTQYIMSLKWQLWQGNWWLRCNGRWIGYYPASLFSTSGLRNEAEKVAWYGEIVDSGSHAGTTRTDMGNGHWPYEGWQHCAYMSNLAYQSGTGGSMSRYDPGSVYATHPKCYGIEGHFSNTWSWGPYFWWGGSGKNAQCP
jgi:Neprosin